MITPQDIQQAYNEGFMKAASLVAVAPIETDIANAVFSKRTKKDKDPYRHLKSGLALGGTIGALKGLVGKEGLGPNMPTTGSRLQDALLYGLGSAGVYGSLSYGLDKLLSGSPKKTASTAGYDDVTSTSNYINMSDPRSNVGTGETGVYRSVPIVDAPVANNSFLGFTLDSPNPYVLKANAARLRKDLARIKGLDVAPEDYKDNWADEGPVVEYGNLGYELDEAREKLILEALKRGRVS